MYGNSLEQMVAVVSPYVTSLTNKVKVIILSQPAALVVTWVAVPDVCKLCSYHMYGNSLEQMVAVVSPYVASLTTKVKVIILSQPAVLVVTWVAVPDVCKLCSYQMNGNSLEQMVAVVSPYVTSLTNKVKVIILSQPAVLVVT